LDLTAVQAAGRRAVNRRSVLRHRLRPARVGVGRALNFERRQPVLEALASPGATDADIPPMDEPLPALDPLTRDKVQDELKDLKKTIIFVGPGRLRPGKRI
jgi:ABC-type nitrate/sulfonate/bicarbonate transport system ATPase subunit